MIDNDDIRRLDNIYVRKDDCNNIQSDVDRKLANDSTRFAVLEYQQKLNTEQQKVVEVMNSLIQKTLDEYRVKNGYNVIITKDSLLSYDSSSDITNDIITILNSTPLTFEPVVLDRFDPETIVPPLSNNN